MVSEKYRITVFLTRVALAGIGPLLYFAQEEGNGGISKAWKDLSLSLIMYAVASLYCLIASKGVNWILSQTKHGQEYLNEAEKEIKSAATDYPKRDSYYLIETKVGFYFWIVYTFLAITFLIPSFS